VQGLLERIPDLNLGIERVEMIGAPPRPDLPPGRIIGADDPPPSPAPPLEETFRRIEQEAQRYEHVIPPGATDEAIASVATSELGKPLHPDLVPIYRWSNGATLYQQALTFYTIGEGGSIGEWNRIAGESGYSLRGDMTCFAETRDGIIVWAIDTAGIVHGLGREGIVYGPQAPLAKWLVDEIADLAYAWDNQQRFPWAEPMLWCVDL
jgi:hypothetical protein